VVTALLSSGRGFQIDYWKPLHLFENGIRIEMAKLLSRFEIMSFSALAEVPKRLMNLYG